MAATGEPPLPVSRVCLYGLGQFGFALAKLLSDKLPTLPIIAYDPVKEYVDSVQKDGHHPVFHKGIKLNRNVTATHDVFEALRGADLVILAVPGQFLRNLIKTIVSRIDKPVILLNVAKALEKHTNKVLSEVVAEEMVPCKHPWFFAALSGGMIAEEVTKYWPIGADIACAHLGVAAHLQDMFCTPHFKVNITTDVYGVELAGALKNVAAIGAGFFDGLGFAMSSKAAYISEASKEIRDLAIALGAKGETFDMGTHAWLALEELAAQRKISEGYLTTKCFYDIAKAKGIRVPIITVIYDVLFLKAQVSDVLLHMFKTSKL